MAKQNNREDEMGNVKTAKTRGDPVVVLDVE